MRIVIIGGMGLIGRAVTEMATAKGHFVVVTSRTTHSAGAVSGNVVRQQWDGKSAEDLRPIIDGLDAVINLAGESIGKGLWTSKRKAELLQSRLVPAQALVEALKLCQEPPQTLIQASAIGYYGTGTDEKDEDSTPGTDYLAKFAAQWEESTKAVEELGIRRVIIRSGIVLQKGEGVLTQLMLPFKLMVGGPVGSGKQIFSWIHIRDEAAAILYLLKKSEFSGVFNLTAPKPKSNSDMGRVIAKAMRRPYWMPVPGFALKLLLGEMSTLVLDGQKVMPKRLLEAGYIFCFDDLEEAVSDLLKK
ncbi:MAG: TIGR01777 family protein [Chloroflexi bacterium HGW-Chloroflexi-4]|nr:MAG: TIGR01777 family protein [Chloroflexi bacterium HGW-Chloroflexi-4]